MTADQPTTPDDAATADRPPTDDRTDADASRMPRPGAPGWTVTTTTGTAADLHDRAEPEPADHRVWIHTITAPALVLGSTQDATVVDRRAATAHGVEICRRRTGGGLVDLVPGRHCWIDVIIPATSPWWEADVGRAFHWLGEVWARTVADLVTADHQVTVHRDRPRRREAGRVICFAGVGAGEVILRPATLDLPPHPTPPPRPTLPVGAKVVGAKVVGLSQRRWRTGARFQGALLWDWTPELLASYLHPAALATDGIRLDQLAIGLPAGAGRGPLDADRVARRFLSHLPDPDRPTGGEPQVTGGRTTNEPDGNGLSRIPSTD
ncbi:MAG: lipoyl protein ligase domain-containing protein [Acidimicrobiales bacterium]